MLGRKIQTLLEVDREAKHPLLVAKLYSILINFHKESGIVTFSSIEITATLEVSNGCEAHCPEEAENYGFL